MRANRKEPKSAPFWFQSLRYFVARMAASYIDYSAIRALRSASTSSVWVSGSTSS